MTHKMTHTRYRQVARELKEMSRAGGVLTRDEAMRLVNRHHVHLDQLEAIAVSLEIEPVEALSPTRPEKREEPARRAPASAVDATARRAILSGSAYRVMPGDMSDDTPVVVSWGMFRRERALIVTWLAELGAQEAVTALEVEAESG